MINEISPKISIYRVTHHRCQRQPNGWQLGGDYCRVN
jgi:hypothetical protein